MKKAILFIFCLVGTSMLMMAQTNDFGFKKEQMNGSFVHKVKTESDKIIYAVDLAKLKSDDHIPVFVDLLSTYKQVYPVSTVSSDKLFFIAGFISVVNESEVKSLMDELKTKAENEVASSQAKKKFPASK